MSPKSTLYDQDFDRWAKHQADLLRQGRVQDLDIEHLIAELEDMGKGSLRELESRFISLIAHLLEWQYQLPTLAQQWHACEGKSWGKTIIEQRAQLSFLLDKVPSLKASLELARQETYPAARRLAIKETGMPPQTFPDACPFTARELLDEDFLPADPSQPDLRTIVPSVQWSD
ncbi:MAG: DUF29 domain-containing protein [Chloroflexia bacterium]|nr:DUF29 domain-containing protein [Chloroflexia bacterium]